MFYDYIFVQLIKTIKMKNLKMKLLIVFCFLSLNIRAQEKLLYEKEFSAYSEYLNNQHGIKCLFPKEFSEQGKYYVLWKVRADPAKHIGSMYGPVFFSQNEDCLLLYAGKPHYVNKKDIANAFANIESVLNRDTSAIEPNIRMREDFPRSQISGEIKTALGLYYHPHSPLNRESSKFNFNDFVTIISGKKAKEMFNADSIFIYDLPNADSVYFFDESLEKMRKEKYPYCTGMFLSKKGRATMEVKFFFTKNGVKKKNQYIEMLNKHIWYDEKFLRE
jgi:hypothetical protein